MKALKPIKIDSQGPAWLKDDVLDHVADECNEQSGSYLTRTFKNISSPDFDRATKTVDEARKMFETSADKLGASATKMAATAKKASQDVRKAADDMASGLLKIEKQANFNNLERYVSLLERAASAMQSLAELEKSGKLEKIAASLK